MQYPLQLLFRSDSSNFRAWLPLVGNDARMPSQHQPRRTVVAHTEDHLYVRVPIPTCHNTPATPTSNSLVTIIRIKLSS